LLRLRLFSSQTFSHINTPTSLKPSHSSHLPTYEDGTDSVPKRRHINSNSGELPSRKHAVLKLLITNYGNPEQRNYPKPLCLSCWLLYINESVT